MGVFYPRSTPPHRPTELRVVCSAEGGKHGRRRLQAYLGDRLITTCFYEWNRWEGHCSGQLLMDDFLDHAERLRAEQDAVDLNLHLPPGLPAGAAPRL